jgi:hypothetical protein
LNARLKALRFIFSVSPSHTQTHTAQLKLIHAFERKEHKPASAAAAAAAAAAAVAVGGTQLIPGRLGIETSRVGRRSVGPLGASKRYCRFSQSVSQLVSQLIRSIRLYVVSRPQQVTTENNVRVMEFIGRV